MSAPASDPPAQPPTGGNNNEKMETPAAAATGAAPEAKSEDVEMKQEEEKVDRFEDVPEHVLKVCPCGQRVGVRC